MEKTCKTIGIIMDGNRRWAKAEGLSAPDGHKKGGEKLKEVIRWTKELAAADNLVFYALSTENWKRDPLEVNALLELLKDYLSDLTEVKEEKIRLRMIGERERFPKDIQELMEKAEAETAAGTAGTVLIALSYGGRSEILNAVNALLASGTKSVDEHSFGNALWTTGIPDPDIIIRTGGARRLSNFLPWQSVYSEFFFIDSFWPAFTKEEYQGILTEFVDRKRNFGK